MLRWGVLNLVLACTLSEEIEMKEHETCRIDRKEDGEYEPSLGKGEQGSRTLRTRRWRTVLRKVSKKSRALTLKRCCLFALDALASGLVPG